MLKPKPQIVPGILVFMMLLLDEEQGTYEVTFGIFMVECPRTPVLV